MSEWTFDLIKFSHCNKRHTTHKFQMNIQYQRGDIEHKDPIPYIEAECPICHQKCFLMNGFIRKDTNDKKEFPQRRKLKYDKIAI